MKYLAVIEYGPNNYGGYFPDVLGCVATGKTAALVAESLAEALSGFLEGIAPPPIQTLDAREIELASGDTVIWIEAAPQNPVSLELERVLREKRLTQTEVAKRMGVPRQSVHRMLSPFYWNHNTETLRKFAQAVGSRLEISLQEV